MLKRRQMIPPLTARTAAGQIVHAWDYKQKRNLVVLFLHAECRRCEEYLLRFAEAGAELAALEAVALAVFPAAVPAGLAERLPSSVLAATDMSGRSQRAYLGEDTFGPAGLTCTGAFVADRYGELYAHWSAADADGLPASGEILSWLRQIEIACEECGVSHWPTD